MTGKEIYANFASAPGAQGLEEASAVLGRLERQDAEIGEEVRSGAATLEESWEGQASGAAQRGAGPLAVDHAVSSEQTHTAKDLLRRQSESYDYVKSNVVPVPEVPASPPSMADVATDPAGASYYYQQKQAALAAEEQNVRSMGLWDNHSTYNEQMMPTRYGNDADTTFSMADVGGGGRSSVDMGSASAPQAGGSGAGTQTGSVGVIGAAATERGTSSGSRPGSVDGSSRRSATRSAAGSTPSTATGSTQLPTTGRPSETPTPRPSTSMPLSGGVTGQPPAGGSGVRSGLPGASGPRPRLPGGTGGVRGGAPGAGAGPRGGAPGPGAGLRGGAPGAPGAGGAGTRGGLAGGRAGVGAGMAGGAGAGRGRGEDDKEHKDRYALPEQLDDGLKREADEFGERTIDEQSGHTVVSQVIGGTNPEQTAAQESPTSKPAPAKPAEASGKPVVRSSNPYAPPSPGPDQPRRH